VESRNFSHRDKLNEALALLSREDPAFTTGENEGTGRLIISGMGELHPEALVSRTRKEYGLEAQAESTIYKAVERGARSLAWTPGPGKGQRPINKLILLLLSQLPSAFLYRFVQPIKIQRETKFQLPNCLILLQTYH
jgi:hypothetical protein